MLLEPVATYMLHVHHVCVYASWANIQAILIPRSEL